MGDPSLQASPPDRTGEDSLRGCRTNEKAVEEENGFRRCFLHSITDLGILFGQLLIHFQTFISSALHREGEHKGNPFKNRRF